MEYTAAIESPVGRLAIMADDAAILAIEWHESRGGNAAPTPLLAEAIRQLRAYFAGELSEFDLPLTPQGSDFEQRVWAAMRAIPYGATRSYGELASDIGSIPRAVGRACGRNPIPIIIPCHRVLSKTGLGGYSGSGGVGTKHRLLALEGVVAPLPATEAKPAAA
jgi:methylated-DNA-[protein]-cysteine S-methyltransferase